MPNHDQDEDFKPHPRAHACGISLSYNINVKMNSSNKRWTRCVNCFLLLLLLLCVCVCVLKGSIFERMKKLRKHTNLYISFCSFYPFIPHIANKCTPPFSNRVFHRKSTVVNDLLKHKISLLTRTCWRSMVNSKDKIEQTSSNSDSCWMRTILLYARS